MRVALTFALSLPLVLLPGIGAANDFPTQARVEFVLGCMNEQGGQSNADVEVTSSGTVTGSLALTLDSRNYRITQHMDKNGKPYQAPREY